VTADRLHGLWPLDFSNHNTLQAKVTAAACTLNLIKLGEVHVSSICNFSWPADPHEDAADPVSDEWFH
jgi:hypothetical protein